ncbi:MAG TPA: ROK family protein [Candidatus Limnocylindrales bacterium]|nr:ROK family protein [Candidatus Limnocylindrales bacterium]
MSRSDLTGGLPVLALDLGASRLRAAVVRSDGRLDSRAERETPAAEGPAAAVQASLDLLREVRAALADTGADVAGVGISVPGPVDARRGRFIEPPNLGPAFRDAPFAEPIGEALGLPWALERDTHVAALAEGAFGAARGVDDFLYLTVSTGLGGAIVTEGRLMTGPDGVAGELGHLPVELDGPPCSCGSRGHLEALSSGSGIARRAAEAIAAGRAPGLAQLAHGRAPAALTARDVAEAESAGDPAAAAIMGRARAAFAAAMVGLVDVFAPSLIVVGGSLARNQGERWLAPAREAVAREAFRVPRERVRIVPAELGDDVGLVGALPLLALRGVGAGAARHAPARAAQPGRSSATAQPGRRAAAALATT